VALARFEKVCVDAAEPRRLGPFYAALLDRRWEPDAGGEGAVVGPTPQHTVRINKVARARTVKNRVHLDVYVPGIAAVEALGGRVVLPKGDDRGWTVMVDPEGGVFCAFVRPTPPADRLHGLVVDAVDPAAQAQWWADVYGARVEHDERGWSTVDEVPEMPILTMDFNRVPEPRVGPNWVHWDVAVADVGPLLEAGATVLRRPGGNGRRWVLADPEGNEFCILAPDD
jgi:hypothetical protein